MTAHVHIVVEGLVQGVGFRWFVSRIAGALNLSGYVTNRPEGTVEIVARGDQNLLQDFVRQVRVGPRSSRVTHVQLRWNRPEDALPSDERSRFEIR
ncbi:MAG: acylphosphatase [Ignavibacteria bacterium]|nr:acylphosphatase [Ignavibacteria bacterium]